MTTHIRVGDRRIELRSKKSLEDACDLLRGMTRDNVRSLVSNHEARSEGVPVALQLVGGGPGAQPRLTGGSTVVDRVLALLDEAGDGGAYTIDNIYDHVGADSVEDLVVALLAAARDGLVETFVVVRSVTGFGIAEYACVSDVPSEVVDPYLDGEVVEVMPRDVVVYYRRTSRFRFVR